MKKKMCNNCKRIVVPKITKAYQNPYTKEMYPDTEYCRHCGHTTLIALKRKEMSRKQYENFLTGKDPSGAASQAA